jgi:hypothetical protein
LKTEFNVNKNSVPTLQKSNTIFFTQANQLMLFTEIIPERSEEHTQNTNTRLRQNGEFCVVAVCELFPLVFKRSSNAQ